MMIVMIFARLVLLFYSFRINMNMQIWLKLYAKSVWRDLIEVVCKCSHCVGFVIRRCFDEIPIPILNRKFEGTKSEFIYQFFRSLWMNLSMSEFWTRWVTSFASLIGFWQQNYRQFLNGTFLNIRLSPLWLDGSHSSEDLQRVPTRNMYEGHRLWNE